MSSLVKYSAYSTEINIAYFIRQLVKKVKKIKLVLEYSFSFRKKK